VPQRSFHRQGSREGHRLEKGEVAILGIQFGALLIVVLVVGNLFPGFTTPTATALSGVYWGDPAGNELVSNAGNLKTTANQSTIFVYFHIGEGTAVASASASRFCTDKNGTTGESTTYVRIQFAYDSVRKANYLVITPTYQKSGWSCVYSVQITDTLQQTVRWTAIVELTNSTHG
jgi:hypothetical protein